MMKNRPSRHEKEAAGQILKLEFEVAHTWHSREQAMGGTDHVTPGTDCSLP